MQSKEEGRQAACDSKHRLRVPARQANSLHPPRTAQQPQACSTGRRSVTAPVLSKEKEMQQPVLACSSCKCFGHRQTVCNRLAPKRFCAKRSAVFGHFADSLHPPRTKEQPQACSTGRRAESESVADQLIQSCLTLMYSQTLALEHHGVGWKAVSDGVG